MEIGDLFIKQMSTNATSLQLVLQNTTAENSTSNACYMGKILTLHVHYIFAIRAVWFCILSGAVIINALVIYAMAKQKTSSQNIFHRIMISTFLGNIIYTFSGTFVYILEDISCKLLLVSKRVQTFGSTAVILAAMAISILQYQQVKVSDINNKLITGLTKRQQTRVTYHLIYIWTFSLVSSTLPLIYGYKIFMLLPNILSIKSIVVNLVYVYKTFKIVKKHRIRLLTTSLGKNYIINLLRSERTLQGSGLLLILAWIPTLSAQWILLYLPMNANKIKSIVTVTQVGLLYTIGQPILYILKTKEISKFLISSMILCKSEEENRDEEFYRKLRLQRKFMRKQIKPFIIKNAEKKDVIDKQ